MAAAVAHRDHDEAHLRQAVGAHHALGPGDVVGLDLRAGIDVVDDRIDLGGVEVERLVHRAVEVGDAVGGLDLEALRHLVARCVEQAEVSLLEQRALAVAPEQPRLRGVVHARAVAHGPAAVVARNGVHVHVVHVQLLDRAAGEAHAVGVHLVGVLALVDAAGGEEHVAFLFIDLQHVLDVVGAVGEVAHQGAVGIVQVEVGPAVALGPPQQLLAAGEGAQLALFHVSVHPLGDDGPRGVARQVHPAHVDAVQVAGAAAQVETVVVAQPHARAEFAVGLGVLARADGHVHRLVLEGVDAIALAAAVRHREHVELLLRARLAGHLVFVGLERRARLAQGVDHPEVLDLAHVGLDRHEMLAVRRPHDAAGPHAAGGVRLGVAHVVVAAVAVLADAVGGEAVLHQGGVLVVLGGLGEVLLVHPEEVGVLDIHAGLAVRGDAGPCRILFLLGLVFAEPAGGNLILEVVDLLGHFRLLGALGGFVSVFLFARGALLRQRIGDLLRALDVEAEELVVLQLELLDREMLRVEGIADDRGDFHRELLHVEDLALAAGLGIHDPVLRPFRGLPYIPELVRMTEPVGLQGGGEHHLGNAFLGELGSQVVVGLHAGRAGTRCGEPDKQRQQKDGDAFHVEDSLNG